MTIVSQNYNNLIKNLAVFHFIRDSGTPRIQH